MLKPLVLILALLSTISCVAWAEASTLSWDRNQTDLDVATYKVYKCGTAGCTVTQVPANVIGTVPQPAAGVVPSFPVTILGLSGAFAVSATDLSGNESALSVPLPFDSIAPPVPQNLRLVP